MRDNSDVYQGELEARVCLLHEDQPRVEWLVNAEHPVVGRPLELVSGLSELALLVATAVMDDPAVRWQRLEIFKAQSPFDLQLVGTEIEVQVSVVCGHVNSLLTRNFRG